MHNGKLITMALLVKVCLVYNHCLHESGFVTSTIALYNVSQGGHKPGKPRILRDFSEHAKLGEFSGNSVQPQGKIVTNKVFVIQILCKTAADRVIRMLNDP